MRYLIFVLSFVPFALWAQEGSDKLRSFNDLDTYPVAPGCNPKGTNSELSACFQQHVVNYIRENYEYPEESRKNKEEGKIYIQFVIEKDCTMSKVEIVRSSGFENLDRYAVELVKGFKPCDEPAMIKGEPVRLQFVIPINMSLTK